MQTHHHRTFSIPACMGFSLALATCYLPAMASVNDDPAAAETNIFSSPGKTEEIPRYVRRDKQQMNRRMMGEVDGIPGWQELKVLPSLNPEQRKKIHELFEQSKRDAEPLVQELKELRQKPGMQGAIGPEPFAASKARNAFGAGDFRNARIQRPGSGQVIQNERVSEDLPIQRVRQQDSTSTNIQWNSSGTASMKPATLGPNMQAQIPFGSERGSFRMGAPVNPEQIVKVRNLQRELRNKRLAAWDQVKALLTEENMRELELMRKGELLPESLKADSREPASSSLGKQSQPDFPPMMMAPSE